MMVWGTGRCGCGEYRVCGWYTWSGIVYSAADVLVMSGLRRRRGVGGVCEMCIGLVRCRVGSEGVSE